jgi:hypothetical protein
MSDDMPILTACYDALLIIFALILIHIYQNRCKEYIRDRIDEFIITIITAIHLPTSVHIGIAILRGFEYHGQFFYVYPRNHWLLLWIVISYLIITILMTKNDLWHEWLRKQSILYIQSKYENVNYDVCDKFCNEMKWIMLPIRQINQLMKNTDQPTIDKVFDAIRIEHNTYYQLEKNVSSYREVILEKELFQ